MPQSTPVDLAEALAAASPGERRRALAQADQLLRQQCSSDGSLALPLDAATAQRRADTAKALADPVRLQLVELLRRQPAEVCQCDLQPLFDVSQPTLSHHLAKLVDAGLIVVDRRGRWAYYSINPEALDDLRSWLS
ncbi:MAG: metalloregulator ArsR/SmtB family transcription factor [Solirubrobacteraceae bacterium]|nr:metalloregulator ArsR/SmtB family transcription factor [Solirubrobacteraceae bacterium]